MSRTDERRAHCSGTPLVFVGGFLFAFLAPCFWQVFLKDSSKPEALNLNPNPKPQNAQILSRKPKICCFFKIGHLYSNTGIQNQTKSKNTTKFHNYLPLFVSGQERNDFERDSTLFRSCNVLWGKYPSHVLRTFSYELTFWKAVAADAPSRATVVCEFKQLFCARCSARQVTPSVTVVGCKSEMCGVGGC